MVHVTVLSCFMLKQNIEYTLSKLNIFKRNINLQIQKKKKTLIASMMGPQNP